MSPDQALSRLARLCSRGEKSVFDIRKKLLDWDFAALEIEEIIKQLQISGFVDDRRYTQAFVHDKSTLARWGALKIRNALKNKKIQTSIIDEVLAGIDNLTVRDNLAHLLSLKKKSLAKFSTTEQKIKLLRFALSRGYAYEEAYKIVNELLK